MIHELATRFDHAEQVLADIDTAAADHRDHRHDVRAMIDTYHPKLLDLVVTDAIEETLSCKTFRLRQVNGESLPPFLAGQYINLYLDGTSRPFAFSSSPRNRDYYDLTVRRVAGGRISNMLLDSAYPGDVFTSTGPMGTFHHNPLFHGDNVLFLAGGSGVAPAMSMIREIVDTGLDRRFHLIYGSRSCDDIIFADELDSLSAHHNITVDKVITDADPSWTGPTGLLSASTISTLTGGLDNRMVYVCGPQPLYPYALEQLAALGHPRRRVRFEANGAPVDPTTQTHWPADTDPDEHVTVTVGEVSFRTPRRRPLLDALEDNGVYPEAACRSGQCSVCRVRVVDGQVVEAQEAQLRLSDKQFGYTHSCVAYPLTDIELKL